MRTGLFLLLLFLFTTIRAQLVLPHTYSNLSTGTYFSNPIGSSLDSLSKTKWAFNKFQMVNASYSFFNGGASSIISAPMGFQVNRILNRNWVAFANIVVAPAYVNFSGASFMNTGFNKYNSFAGQNSFGMYSAASMGLLYINSEKTFSISGSISIQRSNNPFLPVYSNNNTRPHTIQ